MRRFLVLLAVLIVFTVSTEASFGPTQASARSAAGITVDVPARAKPGRAVALTLRLPARAAAVDGRVFMRAGSGELLGVAPRAGGLTLRPVPIKGGAAFGAYGLTASGAETLIDLVVVPHRKGRIQVRVVIDALADREGRRMAVSGGDRTGTLSVGRDRRILIAPLPSNRPLPLRQAGALRELQPDGRFDRRDVDVARAGWEEARLRGTTCVAAANDTNGDGCVDVVDLQATLAAKGTRTGIDRPRTPGLQTVSATNAALGTTFVVTDPGDTPDATPGDGLCADSSGSCTLRAALTEANWTAGADRIHFNLPGPAPARIQLVSGGPRLPLINSGSGGVTIDGYTQPGSRLNDATVGSNAIPGVEIRGNGYSSSVRETPFFITSSGNTIRGLLIQNTWRPIFVDGPNASGNTIVGNWIGFTASGANHNYSSGHAVSFTNGAHDNVVGSANPADRNVIGNHNHAIDQYGAGTNGQVFQNNLLCLGPSGLTVARCAVGIDHNFGPKAALIGGNEPGERNVIGGTSLNGIEFSHGWVPNDPAKTSTLEWQINDHRVIGNWIGFRGDGSYHIDFRSGLGNQGTGDNGNGVNVYDGSNDNRVEGNHIAARWDGVQLMMSNALRNTVRNNTIGESPLGQATAMSGWGIKVRIGTRFHVIEGNVIKNAPLGGIGLIQNNVHNVRISRNLVMDTNGHAIDLYGLPGPDPNDPGDADDGANSLLNTPVLNKATTTSVGGTALRGATVEVYRASRAAGLFGLPVAFLGAVVVASDDTWSLPVALQEGDRVTALQIRSNDDTSELSANMLVGPAPVNLPPVFATDLPDRTDAEGNNVLIVVSALDPEGDALTYSATGLPDGIAIDTDTGAISGTLSLGSAGVHSVTLTVSDGQLTDTDDFIWTVTDTDPATVSSDTFGRTVESTWASADVGGPYTITGPSGSYSVNGSTGAMDLSGGGANRSAALLDSSALDVDLRFRVALDKLPVGGNLWIYGLARQTGTTSVNGYRPKLRIAPNGEVFAHAGRVVSNSESSLGSQVLVTGLTAQPGGFIWLRTLITGANPTTVRVKAWADGQAEPAEWHFTATDAAPETQVTGAVGLRAYVAAAVSNGPIVASFDDFLVTDPTP